MTFADIAALALALAERDPQTLAALRAAREHGRVQGYAEGFARSFDPAAWTADQPDLDELAERRAACGDGTCQDPRCPARVMPGYAGGPVAWEGDSGPLVLGKAPYGWPPRYGARGG